MKKTNVWEVASAEAADIIKGVQKGDFKCVMDYREYLEALYNWKIVEGISRIVEAYAYVNDVELPFELDSGE